MSSIQQWVVNWLPESWSRSMREESEGWKVICSECEAHQSVWELGGIRWKAASKGKRIYSHCQNCGCQTWARVEWLPDSVPTSESVSALGAARDK